MEARQRQPSDFVGYGLIRRAAALAEDFRQALRPFDLTPSQFSAMAVLQQDRDHTPAELARAIVMTPQSVGPLLDGLEKRGVLVRPGARGRGRTTLPRLTDDGVGLLQAAYQAVERLDEQLRSDLGDDYDALAHILRRWTSRTTESAPAPPSAKHGDQPA